MTVVQVCAVVAFAASHHHGHGHHHHPHGSARGDLDRAFAFGVGLNLAFVVAQVAFGLLANSLALVADAGHNLSDVLSLGLAWWARRLEKRGPTVTHTYGLRSASILAALTNAVLLLLTMGALGWEAITRFGDPVAVDTTLVILVASVGVLVNGASALPFLKGRHQDLNVGAAYAHLLADAGVSAGVVIAGIAIRFTGAGWIDPLVTLLIVAIIVHGTRGMLRDSLNLALHAAPRGIDVRAVHNQLTRVPGVAGTHDLHIWALSTTETALTVHLVLQPGAKEGAVLADATAMIKDRFAINHVTIQIERPAAEPMELRRS
ncbi:MAG: cation transporter [Acidobacteria bacterium]|nr:cation transporter [Acidobacteriota bacterium]